MQRYSRHMDLLGEEDFSRISKASVMVAGAGGLGSTVLNLLVRMGIGTIHLFEYDTIEAADLNRQILYYSEDIGSTKCEVAGEKLKKINPDSELIIHSEKIIKNSEIPDVDLVFDCLDNFTSRYILDDLIFPRKIPMIHAGVSTWFGQLTLIIPGKTECLRKTIPVEAESFDKTIVKEIFPPVVTTVASLQVSEGVKYLTGDLENTLCQKIMLVDMLTNSFDVIELK